VYGIARDTFFRILFPIINLGSFGGPHGKVSD